MAVLGVGGRLEIKRPSPEACFVPDTEIDVDSNQLLSFCDDKYLNGDHVTAIGLPIQGDGIFPTKPDGYASYEGSRWYLGPNRTQIDSDNDDFYKSNAEEYPTGAAGDDAQFYSRTGDEACINGDCENLPGVDSSDYWIHINELGYVSFYTDRCQALLGCKKNRVDLINVGGPIIVAPYGSGEYQNGLAVCYDQLGLYSGSDVTDSITLDSICDDAPLYQVPEPNNLPYDNADVEPRGQVSPDAFWQIVCEIREWTLELDAPAVDTQGVGEKFGSAVKSVVSGGGSLEYFIDRECLSDCNTDPLQIMQMLLMTNSDYVANARFWLLDRGNGPCDYVCGPLPGEIYYETDILITRSAVNLRPKEIVAGTAQFVTTGDIKLLIGPNA